MRIRDELVEAVADLGPGGTAADLPELLGRPESGLAKLVDEHDWVRYTHEYQDIAAVVDAVGPPRFLFGHSSGAICALGATLVTAVDKLVLVEPPLPLDAPAIDPEHHAALREALDGGELETAVLIALRHALKLDAAVIEALRSRDDWPEVLQRGVAWLRELDEINQLPPDVERHRGTDAAHLRNGDAASPPQRGRGAE